MTKVLFTPQNQLRPHDVHTQTLCLCHVASNESFDEAQASASQHPARLQPSSSFLFLINHPHKFLRVRPLPPPCWGESAGGRGIGDLWDANANVFLHAVAGHWCQVVSRVLGENIRNCRPLWNSGGKWWQTVVFNSASETWFRTFQNYILGLKLAP